MSWKIPISVYFQTILQIYFHSFLKVGFKKVPRNKWTTTCCSDFYLNFLSPVLRNVYVLVTNLV